MNIPSRSRPGKTRLRAWRRFRWPGPGCRSPLLRKRHPRNVHCQPFPPGFCEFGNPNPPKGVEGLESILLSSLPVTNLAEAYERTQWYSCRWICEDFHQCLKTGCQIERSQLDERTDLEALLGFAAPIALRLLQMRQAAREHSDVPASTVVDPLMVEVLAQRLQVSEKTMTMHEFWRLVARLGGFLGRKGDLDPGWRTVWWGWRYLSDLTDGARLILNNRT